MGDLTLCIAPHHGEAVAAHAVGGDDGRKAVHAVDDADLGGAVYPADLLLGILVPHITDMVALHAGQIDEGLEAAVAVADVGTDIVILRCDLNADPQVAVRGVHIAEGVDPVAAVLVFHQGDAQVAGGCIVGVVVVLSAHQPLGKDKVHPVC